jgi:hypothetical protein
MASAEDLRNGALEPAPRGLFAEQILSLLARDRGFVCTEEHARWVSTLAVVKARGLRRCR